MGVIHTIKQINYFVFLSPVFNFFTNFLISHMFCTLFAALVKFGNNKKHVTAATTTTTMTRTCV